MNLTLKDIQDDSVLLSHVLTQSDDVVNLVVGTNLWQEKGEVEVKVLFNGVEADGSVLEEVLNHFVSEVERQLFKQYKDVEAEVNRRVNQKWREIMDGKYDKVNDILRLMEQLDQIEVLNIYE